MYVPSPLSVITFSGASSGLPFHKTPQSSSEPATTYVEPAGAGAVVGSAVVGTTGVTLPA